jgi:hypothetical protein
VSGGTLAFLAVYVAIQVTVPLRGYCPGADPDWTSRGFNFAWRVMIAEKAGYTELVAYDPATGTRWPVRNRDYISERQEKMMVQDPFMVRELARHIAAGLRARGLTQIQVRAESVASLNGRALQRLIDPSVDLAGAETDDWIVPLQRNRWSSPGAGLSSDLGGSDDLSAAGGR